jgi:Type II secretion system (T2SS), protein E, N-terminal domain
VSVEVVRLLLRAGASEAEVEEALGRAVGNGQSLARALGDGEPVLQSRLERELLRVEVPSLELVRPELEQLALLPPGLADRLGAVPVRRDTHSGRVDIAAVDPLDGHIVSELEFHLGAKVRVLRADPGQVKAALNGSIPPRAPSGPPLPLVRRVITGDARTTPPALAAESTPPPEGDEPILSLSRAKSSQGAPVLGPTLPLELARGTFEQARTPDAVVTALIEGLSPARSVILAVRSNSYVGRAGSAAFERDAVRRVEILNSSPSVLQTATRAGFYLGALPHTPAHGPLRALFGENDGEVYVASVVASEHPTLVIVCDPAALGGSFDATRRIDVLAGAAGQALERILVSRKRGG